MLAKALYRRVIHEVGLDHNGKLFDLTADIIYLGDRMFRLLGISGRAIYLVQQCARSSIVYSVYSGY